MTTLFATPEKNRALDLSSTRWAHDRPDLIINRTCMAFRPYENLISGELDNRTPGKVTGWMRFFRQGKRPLKVTFDLEGDFHEDIRGKVIRLSNPEPSDRNTQLDREGSYVEGFRSVQHGTVGDITAGLPLGPWTQEIAQQLMAQNEIAWDEQGLKGEERERRRREFAARYRAHIEAGDLYYPYVAYPYIEWFSEANGRVVLELDPSQVEVLDQKVSSRSEKTPKELLEDRKKRDAAMQAFMLGMLKELSQENRRQGGDGNVFGGVIG
ncbi:hypothetical protein MYX75_02225 [Acidobacteria bacterium AH-259-A15]|nr:hypothetical protein [Acidobacteria bacterium AH-259-A15]